MFFYELININLYNQTTHLSHALFGKKNFMLLTAKFYVSDILLIDNILIFIILLQFSENICKVDNYWNKT